MPLGVATPKVGKDEGDTLGCSVGAAVGVAVGICVGSEHSQTVTSIPVTAEQLIGDAPEKYLRSVVRLCACVCACE